MEIKVLKADITQLKTDAIVNAANSSLMGGGGVDGAIHRAGGPTILEECKAIVVEQGELPAGNAVITSAGNMPSRYVIHTVGPIWQGGDNSEEEILRKAYLSCLELAEKHQITSLAFPNISTGVYGFPKEKAVHIALKTVKEFKANSLQKVVFVCFDDENYELYLEFM